MSRTAATEKNWYTYDVSTVAQEVETLKRD